MRIFYSMVLVLIFFTGCFQVPPHKQGRTFGGEENDIGYALEVTEDGGMLLFGSTRSKGEGSTDMWLIRISPQGEVSWDKTYGGPNRDEGMSVIQMASGRYMIYGHAWDFMGGRLNQTLLHVQRNGEEIWRRMYGDGSRDLGFSMIEIEDSSYVLAGSNFATGMGDVNIIQTTPSGKEKWEERYLSPNADYPGEIIRTQDGGFAIVGSAGGFYDQTEIFSSFRVFSDVFLLKYSKDGKLEWEQKYPGEYHDFGKAIRQAPDGGYYLLGSTQHRGAGSFDLLLIRTDSQGKERWSKTYGGPDFEYGESMDLSPEGDLYLTGTTKSFGLNGSPDLWILKVGPDGDKLWEKTAGGENSEYGYAVKSTQDGGCAALGETQSLGAGKRDFFLVELTAKGKFKQPKSSQ